MSSDMDPVTFNSPDQIVLEPIHNLSGSCSCTSSFGIVENESIEGRKDLPTHLNNRVQMHQFLIFLIL